MFRIFQSFCLDEGKERYMVAPNSLEDPRVKELCDVSLDLASFFVELETFLCTIFFQREICLNGHSFINEWVVKGETCYTVPGEPEKSSHF